MKLQKLASWICRVLVCTHKESCLVLKGRIAFISCVHASQAEHPALYFMLPGCCS